MSNILEYANKLHLPYIKKYYMEAINKSMDNQYSYEDFLEYVLKGAIDLRN